ncbi:MULTISPECIES: hypothetical protein [Nocardiopsis]|uniref:hypothetical protein n=1 Tax=Nocardiopsis TaxID=2013 RepID=UPI0014781C82|nr:MULTISPECIES: hypothetical protein [Nocardiopsis]
MPSQEHELPVDLIRNDPRFAAELLQEVTGKPLPEHTRVRCDASEATRSAPSQLITDSFVVCERPPLPHEKQDEPVPVLGIITEPQNKWDPRKPYSWPCYVANIRHRIKCPIALLVLTPTTALARRYSAPIDLGCGEIRPLVLALDTLEPVTDQSVAAAHPVLTVLALASNPTDDKAALEALFVALKSLDTSASSLYSDYVLAALSATALSSLEEIMTLSDYEFRTELIGRPFREGEAKGRAEAILGVLDSRGIAVSDRTRDRITGSTDLDELDLWVRRAVRVDRAEDLFG